MNLQALMLLPPWPASLPQVLERSEANRRSRGLLPTSATAAELERNSNPDGAPLPWNQRLETGGPNTRNFLQALGLSLDQRNLPDVAPNAVLAARREFLDVPFCFDSVNLLAKAMTPIESEGPDYDCSHSDPELPFSIFFSIPGGIEGVPILRLCESMLHETMHLQLTLLEKEIPVISEVGELLTAHSPWRDSHRPLRGIIHATYVFFVIQQWCVTKLRSSTVTQSTEAFLRRRIEEISAEISAVDWNQVNAGLTAPGRDLFSEIAKLSRRE